MSRQSIDFFRSWNQRSLYPKLIFPNCSQRMETAIVCLQARLISHAYYCLQTDKWTSVVAKVLFIILSLQFVDCYHYNKKTVFSKPLGYYIFRTFPITPTTRYQIRGEYRQGTANVCLGEQILCIVDVFFTIATNLNDAKNVVMNLFIK